MLRQQLKVDISASGHTSRSRKQFCGYTALRGPRSRKQRISCLDLQHCFICMGFEADELEALEAVFEDAVCVQGDTVTLTASARTAGREEKQFVAAVVVFRVPEAYPETSPDIQLRNVVGLDDRRQAEMLSYLVGLRQDLVGDCMLGPLCEAALEWLSDNNWPDGAVAARRCCTCSLLVRWNLTGLHPVAAQGTAASAWRASRQSRRRIPMQDATAETSSSSRATTAFTGVASRSLLAPAATASPPEERGIGCALHAHLRLLDDD